MYSQVKDYLWTMTTCHNVVSTMLNVQVSPCLISLSQQNLFQPDPRLLACLYGRTWTCQDLVLLSEVLRVIVHASDKPIALQKVGGKVCKNKNGQNQIAICDLKDLSMHQVSEYWLQELNSCSCGFVEILLKCIYINNFKQEHILCWNIYFNKLICSSCDRMHTYISS